MSARKNLEAFMSEHASDLISTRVKVDGGYIQAKGFTSSYMGRTDVDLDEVDSRKRKLVVSQSAAARRGRFTDVVRSLGGVLISRKITQRSTQVPAYVVFDDPAASVTKTAALEKEQLRTPVVVAHECVQNTLAHVKPGLRKHMYLCDLGSCSGRFALAFPACAGVLVAEIDSMQMSFLRLVLAPVRGVQFVEDVADVFARWNEHVCFPSAMVAVIGNWPFGKQSSTIMCWLKELETKADLIGIVCSPNVVKRGSYLYNSIPSTYQLAAVHELKTTAFEAGADRERYNVVFVVLKRVFNVQTQTYDPRSLVTDWKHLWPPISPDTVVPKIAWCAASDGKYRIRVCGGRDVLGIVTVGEGAAVSDRKYLYFSGDDHAQSLNTMRLKFAEHSWRYGLTVPTMGKADVENFLYYINDSL